MTREEAKRRLEVWLKCMDCPKDKQCYDSHLYSTCEYTDYCDETPISEAVKVAIKALEQEPKTGHWTKRKMHKTTGFFLPTCSECGNIQPCTHHTFRWNYCPTCGAKMQEVEK